MGRWDGTALPAAGRQDGRATTATREAFARGHAHFANGAPPCFSSCPPAFLRPLKAPSRAVTLRQKKSFGPTKEHAMRNLPTRFALRILLVTVMLAANGTWSGFGTVKLEQQNFPRNVQVSLKIIY